ncbi:MAG: hypothetical protein C0596_16295 [Marinilabiliales bacterium]|nr:MAG: hypothetical protein C0596_16295 [Marinilabiliales bacterium]
MKRIITILVLISVAFLLIQCNNSKKKPRPNITNNNVNNNYNFDNPPIFRNDTELAFIDSETGDILFTIEAEVASNDTERARGLMYRTDLEENQGMLLLFSREQTQSFYMRNTLISLDIIYVNSDLEIVDIYDHTNPMDETSLPSKDVAQYVVEINAGLCEKYEIEIGDLIAY